ncbi:MAG: uroporphyrinogen-III C-methyltransferase [Sulfuricella denitrificans]|nr:uroporphyrinogen-III C-methyltransferase [Sulfuricella denitrificans]
MNNTGTTPPAQDTPATNKASGWISLPLLISLLTLLLLGWHWLDSRQRDMQMELNLGRRLAEFEVHNKESGILARQTQEAVREAQAKLSLLEQKMAESQSHQMAVEELYQEMSRNRDEWVLAEIEQMLLIASQQLQLAGNVRAAMIALQTAESRLQRLDRPQFFTLRKAINKDIEKLQSLPQIDLAGLNLRLDNLSADVDQLPLLPGRITVTAKPAPRQPLPENFWLRLREEAWQDFKELVRIQNLEKPELPLLPPEQAYFLRENLKLRLLSARLALLQRNEASYKADIKAAEDWLRHYFDTSDKTVRNALSHLKQLGQSRLSIDLPDITASLDAARTFKLAREKSGK